MRSSFTSLALIPVCHSSSKPSTERSDTEIPGHLFSIALPRSAEHKQNTCCNVFSLFKQAPEGKKQVIAKVVAKAFVALMDEWKTHFRQDKAPHERDKVTLSGKRARPGCTLKKNKVTALNKNKFLKIFTLFSQF